MKVGDRVLIVGVHAWAGQTGTIDREMDTPVGKMWVVTFGNGRGAGCMEKNLQLVSRR
jgi:hypothetical protein